MLVKHTFLPDNNQWPALISCSAISSPAICHNINKTLIQSYLYLLYFLCWLRYATYDAHGNAPDDANYENKEREETQKRKRSERRKGGRKTQEEEEKKGDVLNGDECLAWSLFKVNNVNLHFFNLNIHNISKE